MTLTNHLLTGAVLAKVLPLPLAIPLAFASHFFLDALPHFGFENLEVTKRHKKLWIAITILDFILAVSLSIWLIRAGHHTWFLVGLVAYLPDIAWVYRFTFKEKFGKLPPPKENRFNQFHSDIQKYERPWGGIIEFIYATGIFLIIR